jgi:hypothetical protein
MAPLPPGDIRLVSANITPVLQKTGFTYAVHLFMTFLINNLVLTGIFALVTLSAAISAQYRIAFYTDSALSCWLIRAIMVAAGFAFGYIMADYYYPDTNQLAVILIFLCGFGVVHVPLAFILFTKRLH